MICCIRSCASASLSSSVWMRSRSCPFSSRSIRVVRCESANAPRRALDSSACFSWSCWISDCMEDADTEVAAVEALEKTVRGVDVASRSA